MWGGYLQRWEEESQKITCRWECERWYVWRVVVFTVFLFAYLSAFTGRSTFCLQTSIVSSDRILEIFLSFTVSCCFIPWTFLWHHFCYLSISISPPAWLLFSKYVKRDLCWNTLKIPHKCIPCSSIPWTVNETDRWDQFTLWPCINCF